MLLFGLLIAVCFVPGITGASVPTQWAAMSILLPLTLWRRSPMTASLYLMLAFCGYAALSSLWATNYHTSVFGLWLVFIWALAFRLGASLASLRDLWIGLALGLSISSLVAVAQALDYELVVVSPNQYAGLLYNSTVQGMSIALVLIALASHRLWWLMPLPALGLILSGSRGGFLLITLSAIARYTHWLLAIACLIGGSIVFTTLLDPTDSQRLTIWGHAIRGLTAFGWGPGSFLDIYYTATDHTSHAPLIFHPEYVHNDYLQLWFEYGIGALAIFVVLILALAQTSSPDWPVAVAFAIGCTFYFPFYCPIPALVGLVTAGHLAQHWKLDGVHLHRWRLALLSRRPYQFAANHIPRRQRVPLVPRDSQSEA